MLIDEIQECKPPNGSGGITFYDVLNSLMKKKGVDIYVTGSNSEMLSEDIATNFRDRGTVIRMWPLSFSEYYGIGGKEKSDAWEDYLVWGGMPLAVLETRQRARLNFRQMERTHLMENVIYCELCRRGYAVDVGVVDTVAKDASGKSVRRTYELYRQFWL